MSRVRRRPWSRRAPKTPAWPALHLSWVWPRRLDPTTQTVDPTGVVLLGTAGSGPVALVDDHGTVQLADRPWTVEWWIGAEDRWHRSAAEVNVRAHRIGPGPVIETAMKVPGGDIVQRVGAAEARGPVVAVEFENRSGVAVALAAIIRPFALDGPGRVSEIEVDGAAVMVDDRPGVVLDRRPAAVVGGDVDADLTSRLIDAAPPPAGHLAQRCDGGAATVAMVVPLAHAAEVRMIVGDTDPHRFAEVASIDQLGAGWRGHLDGGARLDLPDDDDHDDMATLLITAADLDRHPTGAPAWSDTDRARVLEALVRTGHPSAAADLDRALAARGVRARQPAMAAAVVRRAATEVEPRWFDDYLGWAIDSIGWGLDRGDADARRVVAPMAALLNRSGQTESARQLADRWEPPPPTVWRSPGSLVDPLAAAGRVLARRDRVALDRPDGVDLLGEVPAAWLGQALDVRDLPTAHGPVSFSVRWHGRRPALLWERRPWPDSPPWRLRCPGLDPEWEATDDRGEALLAEPSIEAGQSFG